MRKLILAIAIVLGISLNLKSQTISFGLKGGITASTLKAVSSGIHFSTTTKIGFYAGAMAGIGISDNFSLQPELFYSLMGGTTNLIFLGQTYSSTSNLGYIILPVLLKYKNEGFSIFLGPQIGYLLSSKTKGNSTGSSYKSTDLSGVIGAGYTLSNEFGFDARYQLGFVNISKDASSSDVSVKSNGFLIGMHYYFRRQ